MELHCKITTVKNICKCKYMHIGVFSKSYGIHLAIPDGE